MQNIRKMSQQHIFRRNILNTILLTPLQELLPSLSIHIFRFLRKQIGRYIFSSCSNAQRYFKLFSNVHFFHFLKHNKLVSLITVRSLYLNVSITRNHFRLQFIVNLTGWEESFVCISGTNFVNLSAEDAIITYSLRINTAVYSLDA